MAPASLLDTYALRLLSAAREAALFATAPLIGAVLSVPFLSDGLGVPELSAALLMAAGVILMREKHSHVHTHEPIDHDTCMSTTPPARSTTARPPSRTPHPHRHEPLVHEHPHVSDAHHRHRH